MVNSSAQDLLLIIFRSFIDKYIGPFIHAVDRIYPIIFYPRLTDGKVCLMPEENPWRVRDYHLLRLPVKRVPLLFIHCLLPLLYQ